MNTDVIDKIKDADMILVGIGEELSTEKNQTNELINFYNVLAEMIADKNYFIISINSDSVVFDSELNHERITAPFSETEEISPEGDDIMWEKYMKWLPGTLNKKLVVLELGVLLTKPNVIRWPFERAVMLNEKSHLIRVNKTIPQLPLELKERATSIDDNPLYFFEVI